MLSLGSARFSCYHYDRCFDVQGHFQFVLTLHEQNIK